MSLFITSLNSGSNGNCYYIGNNKEAILVDAGISCREIEKRMKRLDLDMKKVKAIFVSHEHSDHIRGIPTLAKKYALPVYITQSTMIKGGLVFNEDQAKTLEAHTPVAVGELSVTAFPKFHDAADPHSFIIESASITVGVFTDIGAPCEHVVRYFKLCHAAFLEANYDDVMLETGRYPYHLKRRIKGDKGHLSNKQALELFTTHRSPHLSLLLLSHLSKDNNCPNLVYQLFTEKADGAEIVVASRYEETPIFYIADQASKPKILNELPNSKSMQYSLF